MVARQTVFGFFDTVAEAQQAVQGLLARGFTQDTVALSTPTTPNAVIGERTLALAKSSGRFFSALFGTGDDDQPGPARPDAGLNRRPGMLVTVQAQSADEASQVADLLDSAGASDIAVEADG